MTEPRRTEHRHQYHDYGDEVHLAASPTSRMAFLMIGHTFVAVGIVGLFVPLLPTTDMLLIAAACYARGSVRFYNWILNNRFLGPIILNWRKHGAVSRRHKYTAVFLIVVVLGSSIIFFVSSSLARGLLIVLGLAISALILRLPTLVEDSG
ncbi:MAG: YbaN family protein [Gemmatimonadales bacterium]